MFKQALYNFLIETTEMVRDSRRKVEMIVMDERQRKACNVVIEELIAEVEALDVYWTRDACVKKDDVLALLRKRLG